MPDYPLNKAYDGVATGKIDPRDHLALAYAEARRAACVYGGDPEDWLGPVYTFLANAARTFDPSKSQRFSTLAVRSIRWQVYAENKRRSGKQLRACSTEDGTRRQAWIGIPMARMVDDDGHAIPMPDRRDQIDPGARMDAQARWAMVSQAMAALPELHRYVLEQRASGRSLECIADALEVTRERVRRIQNDALVRVGKILGVTPDPHALRTGKSRHMGVLKAKVIMSGPEAPPRGRPRRDQRSGPRRNLTRG